MKDAGIDPLLPEGFGRADHQRLGIIDNPADVVRKGSSRIRSVGALFQRDNFKVRTLPASLGSGAHAGRITTDYD
jgi:hypothetical protein